MHGLPVLVADAAAYDGAAGRRSGIVAGVAWSLLLHGLLIFGFRSGLPPAPVAAPENRAMTVWIRAAPPRVVVVPQQDLARPEPRAQLAPSRPRKKEHQPLENEAPARPPAPAQAITLPAPPPDQSAELRPAEPAPQLDMDAARQTARAVADEPDPKRAPGTLAGQLDQHPLYQKPQETRLAREIGAAKRSNCKDGVPGGLLAPLFLMMDKKDSGCKW
jgi:hypothetical protein